MIRRLFVFFGYALVPLAQADLIPCYTRAWRWLGGRKARRTMRAARNRAHRRMDKALHNNREPKR
jgi:hypothetical protein